MCRGRRARILLHLHIQLEGTVLRDGVKDFCVFYYCRTFVQQLRKKKSQLLVSGHVLSGRCRRDSTRDGEEKQRAMMMQTSSAQ
jgi:hypothetical protein